MGRIPYRNLYTSRYWFDSLNWNETSIPPLKDFPIKN